MTDVCTTTVSREERFSQFVQSLDFRKRAALALLDAGKIEKLKSLPEESWEAGLVVLDMKNRQANGRESWVNGIGHMQAFVGNQDHFIDLIRKGDLSGIDDMITLILDTRSGRLDYLQNHDKRLMALLKQGSEIFFKLRLNTVDYPGLISRIQGQDTQQEREH